MGKGKGRSKSRARRGRLNFACWVITTFLNFM